MPEQTDTLAGRLGAAARGVVARMDGRQFLSTDWPSLQELRAAVRALDAEESQAPALPALDTPTTSDAADPQPAASSSEATVAEGGPPSSASPPDEPSPDPSAEPEAEPAPDASPESAPAEEPTETPVDA